MIPLNQIHVPEPCAEDWDAMLGDAQRRFCAGCGCHVHDLSAMTEAQAQDLIDRTEARICVRFQTRSDGSPLTLDAMPGASGAATVAARPAFRRGRRATVASWVVALAVTGVGLAGRAEAAPQKTAHATAGHKPHAKFKPQTPAKPQAVPAPPERPHRFLGKIVPRRPVKPTPEKPTTQTPAGTGQGQPTGSTPAGPTSPSVMGTPPVPQPSLASPRFLMGGGAVFSPKK